MISTFFSSGLCSIIIDWMRTWICCRDTSILGPRGLILSSAPQTIEDENRIFIFNLLQAKMQSDTWMTLWYQTSLQVFKSLLSISIIDLIAACSQFAEWHQPVNHTENTDLGFWLRYLFLGQWFTLLFPIYKMKWEHMKWLLKSNDSVFILILFSFRWLRDIRYRCSLLSKWSLWGPTYIIEWRACFRWEFIGYISAAFSLNCNTIFRVVSSFFSTSYFEEKYYFLDRSRLSSETPYHRALGRIMMMVSRSALSDTSSICLINWDMSVGLQIGQFWRWQSTCKLNTLVSSSLPIPLVKKYIPKI